MNRLVVLLLALALLGCGSTPSKKQGKTTAKATKKKPAEVKQAPKPVQKPPKPAEKPTPPPEPKKFTVPDNSYPGIPEAMAAMLLAAETAGDGEDPDRDERFKASAWLSQQKDAAVSPLAEKLKDDAVGLSGKIVICRTLGQIGPPAEGTLTEALGSEQQLVRINAAEQLAIIKPTNENIVKTLIGLLDHEDPRMRERAIKSLGFIGPPAKTAAEPLLAILNSDAEEGLRSEAKRALKSVNPRRTFKD